MASLEKIFVVSAPSGAGKTTLNRRLVKNYHDVEISVSLTTRQKRENEIDGVHYHFVTKEEFEHQIQKGEMLEWANVHGNFYGTSKLELRKIADRKHNAILEIDVQGWLNAQPNLTRVTSIFIMPPSMEILWKRLSERGTDSDEDLKRRMMNAKDEIALADKYDHFIINDDLEKAYKELTDIIILNKNSGLTLEAGLSHKSKLLEEFKNLKIFK